MQDPWGWGHGMRKADTAMKMQGVLMPLVQVGLTEGAEGWATMGRTPTPCTYHTAG